MSFEFNNHPIVNELRAAATELRATDPYVASKFSGDEMGHLQHMIRVAQKHGPVPESQTAHWSPTEKRAYEAAVAAAEYIKAPGSKGL